MRCATVTRPAKVTIGERRRPEPDGRLGIYGSTPCIRGTWTASKGVYHINAVDEVTQWQVMGATEQISEAYLVPVVEGMLAQFPFEIRGFHSDNGREFINYQVSGLLNKLLILRWPPCNIVHYCTILHKLPSGILSINYAVEIGGAGRN
jgi:hypothetical protein